VLMRKTLSPPAWPEGDVTPAGIAVAGGTAVIVGTALAAALVRPEDDVLRVALMAIALAVFAATTTARPIVMVALVPLSWLVVNGFLVDRYGVLTWHGPADIYRLLALASAAGAGLIVREARRG
jgi:hypothetical protein